MQSHVLWDLHRDWELELLESLTPDERWAVYSPDFVCRSQHYRLPHGAYIEQIFLARLRQPHSSVPFGYLNLVPRPTDPTSVNLDNEETFQAYSSFTTNYKPTTEYESLLVAASKARSGAVKSYAWKEFREAVLVRNSYSIICLSRRSLKYKSLSHITPILPPRLLAYLVAMDRLGLIGLG